MDDGLFDLRLVDRRAFVAPLTGESTPLKIWPKPMPPRVAREKGHVVAPSLALLSASCQDWGVQRQAVKSSVIRAIGYQESEEVLEVEFASGRVYQYRGVPQSLYDWMFRASSPGGIFNRMIRDQFPEVDVTPVQEQDLQAALRASVQRDRGE